MMRSHRFILAILMSIVAILALFSVSAISAHAEEVPAETASAGQTVDNHFESKNFLLDTRHFDARLDDSNLPVNVTLGNMEDPSNKNVTPAENSGSHQELTIGWNDPDVPAVIAPIIKAAPIIKGAPIVIINNGLKTPLAFVAGKLAEAPKAALAGFVPGVVTGKALEAPKVPAAFLAGKALEAPKAFVPGVLTGKALEAPKAALAGFVPGFINGKLFEAPKAFLDGFKPGVLTGAVLATKALNDLAIKPLLGLAALQALNNLKLLKALPKAAALGAKLAILPAMTAGALIPLQLSGVWHAFHNPLSFGGPILKTVKGLTAPVFEILKDHAQDLATAFLLGQASMLPLLGLKNIAIGTLAAGLPLAFIAGRLSKIPAVLAALNLVPLAAIVSAIPAFIAGVIAATKLAAPIIGALALANALKNLAIPALIAGKLLRDGIIAALLPLALAAIPLALGSLLKGLLNLALLPLALAALPLALGNLLKGLLNLALLPLALLPLMRIAGDLLFAVQALWGTGIISILLRLVFNLTSAGILSLAALFPNPLHGIRVLLGAIALALGILVFDLVNWFGRALFVILDAINLAAAIILGRANILIFAIALRFVGRVLRWAAFTLFNVVGILGTLLGSVNAILASALLPLPITVLVAPVIAVVAFNILWDVLFVDLSSVLTTLVVEVKKFELRLMVWLDIFVVELTAYLRHFLRNVILLVE